MEGIRFQAVRKWEPGMRLRRHTIEALDPPFRQMLVQAAVAEDKGIKPEEVKLTRVVDEANLAGWHPDAWDSMASPILHVYEYQLEGSPHRSDAAAFQLGGDIYITTGEEHQQLNRVLAPHLEKPEGFEAILKVLHERRDITVELGRFIMPFWDAIKPFAFVPDMEPLKPAIRQMLAEEKQAAKPVEPTRPKTRFIRIDRDKRDEK